MYLVCALGYQSLWAVVLPIQLTELIFPDLRGVPWLRRTGLVAGAVTTVDRIGQVIVAGGAAALLLRVARTCRRPGR